MIELLIMAALAGAAIYYFVRDARNRKSLAGGVAGQTKSGALPAPPEIKNPGKAFQQTVLKTLDAQGKLLKRHEMLPFHDLDYTEPMSGHTLEVYQQTERDIQDVRTRWLELQDVSEQVDKLAPPGKPVTPMQYKEVAQLIDSADTEGIEDMLAHCVAELDRLEEAHEIIAPTQEEIRGHLAAIREFIDGLAAAGVEDIPFAEEWDGLNQLAETHLAASIGDPLGRAAPLNTARERLHDVREHLGRLFLTVDTMKEVKDAVGVLRGETDKLRAAGIPLKEPQGNPDPMLAEADREFAVYNPALKRGDVDAACNSTDLASRAVEEAERRIQSTVESRDFFQKEIQPRENEITRLKNMKDEVRRHIQKLEATYAKESWIEILAPIERGEKNLEKMDARLTEARSAFDDQRFIAAANHLETLLNDQEQIAKYFGGAERCLAKLNEISAACVKRRQETSAMATELIEFLKTHKNNVPAHYTRELTDACRLLDQIEQQEGEARPNWPEIKRELDEVALELADVKAEAERITKGFDELQKRAAALATGSQETAAFLEKHTADRPKANQLFHSATRALAAITRELEAPTREVETMRRELDHIEMELREAKDSADKDVQAQAHASHALSQAAKVLKEVRGYNKLGVTPQTSRAETELARARDLLVRQEYEAIPEIAMEVEKLANEAFEKAKHDTREREDHMRQARSQQMKEIVSVGAAVGAQILGEVVRQQVYGHRRPHYHRRHRGFF